VTNADVERAVVTSGEAVGLALENFERRVLERFMALLDAERQQWIDVRDMIAAVATELAEQRKETADKRGELLSGIYGLQQQISEYEALIPPAERVKIAAMVYRHDDELQALADRVAALEARENG
jgi:hypothetical protein